VSLTVTVYLKLFILCHLLENSGKIHSQLSYGDRSKTILSLCLKAEVQLGSLRRASSRNCSNNVEKVPATETLSDYIFFI